MKEMEYQATRKIELLFDEEYKGYHYYILNLGTHPTAYVEIPKGNKLFSKNYNEIYEDDIDIEVHGGLTYSRNFLFLDKDTKKDNSWFIGWDYAHYNDYCGYDELYPQFATGGYKWTTEEIIEECKSVIEQIIKANNN